ncbi:cation transporter [candidate division MSBL1 archaeon SCGC-AAA261F19]|uniref:Cation transporter n=1 Tax=candidate division MSBL1 archaeon SCGC-AAA261F19 TaxID=1698275 RepID=A0A133V7M6_9EURY|nr:cation transporter [candidate division MSBL1 archaeon SCGC-AAA261F19]
MQGNGIERSLEIAIALTSVFFVVEVMGGLISGSLSLLGDAGHIFRDVFALALSLGAVKVAKKLPTKNKTFGYHRVEIFAAFVNAIILIGISGWIFWKAYQRLLLPKPIESTTMFVVAVMGLLVNLYVAFKLHGSQDLNIRSAFIHVVGDTISSGSVIAASVWIFFTGQIIVDSILSVAIGIIILISAFVILKDSVCILLEFTPKEVDFDKIVEELESIKGVENVYSVHMWSLCSNVHALDAHVLTSNRDLEELEKIKEIIRGRLKKYNIKHVTLEFEYGKEES